MRRSLRLSFHPPALRKPAVIHGLWRVDDGGDGKRALRLWRRGGAAKDDLVAPHNGQEANLEASALPQQVFAECGGGAYLRPVGEEAREDAARHDGEGPAVLESRVDDELRRLRRAGWQPGAHRVAA